jgi:hypothetical protein
MQGECARHPFPVEAEQLRDRLVLVIAQAMTPARP